MSQALESRREGPLTEWLLRGFALVIYGVAVTNIGRAWWAEPSRWTLLLLLVTEGFALLMVLLARRATARDMSPLAILATGYAAFFFVLLNPHGTTRWLPETVALAVQVTGMLVQFAAKVALGRSFGLIPARRPLVMGGPYRLVRHPIYFGYFITHVGFLSANWDWRNFGVLALLFAVQMFRIHREERVLAEQAEYRDYQSRVRWRLIPGVY